MVEFLAEPGQGADPEHSDGARVSVHALRDFVVRKFLEVSKHEHGPIILRELFEQAGEVEFTFVTQEGPVRGGVRSGNKIAQSQGGVGEFLVEGDFTCQVAFLRSLVAAHFVGQHVAKDPAQPGCQLRFAGSAKTVKVPDGPEERLLDDVGGIEFGTEAGLGLRAGENLEPGFEVAQERFGGGGLSRARRGDQGGKGFRGHDVDCAAPICGWNQATSRRMPGETAQARRVSRDLARAACLEMVPGLRGVGRLFRKRRPAGGPERLARPQIAPYRGDFL